MALATFGISGAEFFEGANLDAPASQEETQEAAPSAADSEAEGDAEQGEEDSESSLDEPEENGDDSDIEATPSQDDKLTSALHKAEAEKAEQAKAQRLELLEDAIARQSAIAQLKPIPEIKPYNELSQDEQRFVDAHAERYGLNPWEAAYNMQRELRSNLIAQREHEVSKLVGDHREATDLATQGLAKLGEAEVQHLFATKFGETFNAMVAAGAPAHLLKNFVSTSFESAKAIAGKAADRKSVAKDIANAGRTALKKATRGEATDSGSAPSNPHKASAKTGSSDFDVAFENFRKNSPNAILDRMLKKR